MAPPPVLDQASLPTPVSAPTLAHQHQPPAKTLFTPIIVTPPPLIAVTVGPVQACTAVVFRAKQRKRRRTDAECLQAKWVQLRYYRDMKWEPLFEDFGIVTDGGHRYSRRLYLHNLLK